MTPADIRLLAIAIADELERREFPSFDDMDLPPGETPCGAWVYFVVCGSAVKIGYTRDLARRMTNMQMSCPHKLSAAAWYLSKTPERDESAFHNKHASSRIRGEWFHINDSIAGLIRELRELHINRVERALGAAP